jgi:hypothetical protein
MCAAYGRYRVTSSLLASKSRQHMLPSRAASAILPPPPCSMMRTPARSPWVPCRVRHRCRHVCDESATDSQAKRTSACVCVYTCVRATSAHHKRTGAPIAGRHDALLDAIIQVHIFQGHGFLLVPVEQPPVEHVAHARGPTEPEICVRQRSRMGTRRTLHSDTRLTLGARMLSLGAPPHSPSDPSIFRSPAARIGLHDVPLLFKLLQRVAGWLSRCCSASQGG